MVLRFGHDGMRATLTPLIAPPSFRGHVLHVVTSSTREEMGWADTGADIAVVAAVESGVNRPILVYLSPETNGQRRADVVSVALARAETRGPIIALADRPATLAASGIWSGRLTTHRLSPTGGVTPPAGSTVRGHRREDYTSCRSDYFE